MNKIFAGKKVKLVGLAAILLLLLLDTSFCFAETGVTARSIVLATHQPLSGPAKEYSAIGKSARAYFKYVNDQGGIHGRVIDLKIVDDRGHMGLYFHRKLAIKFAMWLDDEFFDWVIDTIDEILHGKINFVKNSISNIKSAEQKLKEAIEKAKRDGNKDAIAIINAYNAKEIAKSNKTKAMKLFSKQISMDL